MERRLSDGGQWEALRRQYDEIAQKKNETMALYVQRFKDATLAHPEPPSDVSQVKKIQKLVINEHIRPRYCDSESSSGKSVLSGDDIEGDPGKYPKAFKDQMHQVQERDAGTLASSPYFQRPRLSSARKYGKPH